MSHGSSCAGPHTREVGKHLGEVAVSYGEGDTDPRNYRVSYGEGDTDPRNYRVSFDEVAGQLGFPCDHTVQDYLARISCPAPCFGAMVAPCHLNT
jgi:hypothetical protein